MRITIASKVGPEVAVRLEQDGPEVVVYVNKWSVVRFQERAGKLRIQLDSSIEDELFATDSYGHIVAVQQ